MYHDGMAVRSQGGPDGYTTTGRVNQKRRTRAAIVEAARAIVERGESPTVAQAAEEALVSRTTAYRYFPTQESLLVEVAVDLSVVGVAELLDQPAGDRAPAERLLELLTRFNEQIADNEAMYRNAQRHYQDAWLAAERSGEGHDRPFREGRRYQWIEQVLAPLRDTMTSDEWERLVRGLCLVIGGEPFIVMRDVCHLDADQATAVQAWVAMAILEAAGGTDTTADA
jgi:AcrR family transcriptional regulator